MKSTRFMISILLLSYSSFSFSTDNSSSSHQQYAQDWVKSLATNLDQNEIQCVANILYLLYANATLELKLRQFVIPMTRLNQTIRSNITNHTNTSNELTTLKTLAERLSHLTGAHTIYNQTLQTCLTHYDKTVKNQLVNDALATVQLLGQHVLNTYAEEKSAETMQALAQSAQVLQRQAPTLQAIANLHQELSDGVYDNYFKNNELTKDRPALATLDEILKNNAIAIRSAEQVLNVLDSSMEYSLAVVAQAGEIYKHYYAALYDHISSDAFDRTHATTLFGMNDILPDEYKSLLPHPDKIFEHILHSIKLYTHTQLIK